MKVQKSLSVGLLVLLSTAAVTATAAGEKLRSPKQGVLCDQYVCADKNGVSKSLTGNYLDQSKAKNIVIGTPDDKTKFIFSDGTYCDVNEQLCYVDKYFENGKRSPVNKYATKRLFGRNIK